jgi:ribose transport system permease protein
MGQRFATPPRWIWSYLAAALVYLAIVVIAAGAGSFQTFSIALQFATFFVIAGLGQMLVITAGPGNIDLSIPGVMTLAGYLATGAMHGGNAGLLPGLALGLLIGVGAGLFNLALIRLLRIPPMVGTLASGFIYQSAAIAYSSHAVTQPSPLLAAFTSGRVLGVSAMTVLFILLTAAFAVGLQRTRAGRAVLALGQNRRAALLAGFRVGGALSLVYLASGLLAAYSGGASLDMAREYLLMSIAVVVIGGTSIAGGDPAPPGLWGAAMLLGLLVTMLNLLHMPESVRLIATGGVIIGVLAIATPQGT